MPRLAIADDAHLREIYRESYALWGAGLTERDYVDLWLEIRETAWAAAHATFYVWLDDRGSVLSSLKLYRPLARIDGKRERISVLGAIFTPRQRRREGHATELVREILAGGPDPWAMLFSDIGPAYYRRLGFRELLAEEHWGNLPRGTAHRRAELELEPYVESDLPDVMAAHERSFADQPLAIDRDRDHWHFLLTRTASYFRRLGDSTVHPRALVARRDGAFVGYLFSVEGRGEWNIREAGAADGRAETIADVLRAGAAAARRAGLKRFYGWLPPAGADALSDWSIRSTPRRRAQPMLRDLAGARAVPDRIAGAYVPYQDQF